jgi:DNA-binding MarR family transcriptional regulator
MEVWIDTNKRLVAIETALMEQLEPTAACDLTPKQIHVLCALYEQDKQRPSDLARAIGTVPTAFTPCLDALERMRLIARRPDATDRRAIVISVASAGLELKRVIQDAVEVVNFKFAGK